VINQIVINQALPSRCWTGCLVEVATDEAFTFKGISDRFTLLDNVENEVLAGGYRGV